MRIKGFGMARGKGKETWQGREFFLFVKRALSRSLSVVLEIGKKPFWKEGETEV